MRFVAHDSRGIAHARRIAFASIALTLGLVSAAFAGNDQWTTNGPYGGPVSVLAIDPLTPATVYAAGISSVYKSTDAGAHWARASNGIVDPSVDALAIDPSTPATLYAGSIFGGKVVKSVDGAATWTPLVGSPTLVVSIAIDPQTPATVYASRQQAGISKSTNGGTTWAPIGVATLPVFPTFKSLAIDPAAPATIYAGDQAKGIYKSVDSGATWSAANTGFTGPAISILKLAIDPHTTSTLYATASTSGGSGLFKSVDSGGHWSLITNGNAATYGFEILAVAVDPQTPANIYIGTLNGTFKSTNGGTAFSPIHTGMPTHFVNTLAINPASTATIYAGTEDGIFATTNAGALWATANNGLGLTNVNAVAVDPTTPATIYAGTASSGIFKSVDSGGSWTAIDAGIGPAGNAACLVPSILSLVIDPKTPSTLYAGTQCTDSSQVLKSVNGGASWTSAATGIPEFAEVSVLAIDPSSTSTIYAGAGNLGLYRSADGGATWTANTTVPLTQISGVSIAFAAPAPSMLVVSGQAIPSVPQKASDPPLMSTSIDGGKTWRGGYDIDNVPQDFLDCLRGVVIMFASAGRKFTFVDVFIACVSPAARPGNGPDEVILANGYWAQVSTTTGARARAPARIVGSSGVTISGTDPPPVPWQAPNGSNDEATACSPVASIVSNPLDPSSFYGAAACGVLKGTQNGQQLVKMTLTGLPLNQAVNALGINGAGNTLYAGIENGGVYQFTFPPQPPTQLAIIDVNNETSPVAGFPFSVIVQAQAADLSPQGVAAATTVQLSVTTGTGNLGGTQTCQIAAGSNSCTVTGVTYSKVETGVVLTATRTSGDTLTPGSSAPFDVAAVGAPPNFVSAVSRKVHGAAGTFNLPLSLVATNPTTEPRTGPAQTIVLTFDKPITGAVVSITEGSATAAAPTFSNSDVIVSLTGVTNQQYVTISLTNVTSSDGGSGGSGSVRVGFLLGDVNQNRVISVADLGLVNAQLAQVVSQSNFLKDVNASGTLSVADKGITNANLTRNLPAP